MKIGPENMALVLLREYWHTELPVNPIYFAQKCKISVFELKDDEQGRDAYYDYDKRAIYVDTIKPSSEQRFAVARELGRALLHKKPSKNETLGDTVVKDTEAKAFAEELLIPRFPLDVYVSHALPYSKLCGQFDIPGDIMDIRLKKLGYYATPRMI